jgi:hypothetical protein
VGSATAASSFCSVSLAATVVASFRCGMQDGGRIGIVPIVPGSLNDAARCVASDI